MGVLPHYSIAVALILNSSIAVVQHAGPATTRPSTDDQYVPGPDSQPQPGVLKGKVFQFPFDHSKVYPGTSRTITVYVPAQYMADKPAPLYVGLDGLVFEAPVVFDNLISKHEMPVTIALGVSAGAADSAGPPTNPRFNRSFEFDGLNDNLARFLIAELIPEVERRKTPDGLPIILSRDPNDRAAGGGSTGGIGAFTLAWERPDVVRRVFTGCGTFVGMRGGDRYPVLVRKTEPKPIRIFMQDGSNDEWMGGPEVGDWWMSNQTLLRALEFAGYRVEYVWGEGIHSPKHATAIFPDAMRWLWKDWPQPIAAGESQNTFLKDILRPGEGWQVVPGTYQSADAIAVGRHGEVLFRDIVTGITWRITGDGQLRADSVVSKPYTAMSFGPDDRIYVTDAANAKIVAYTTGGPTSIVAKGIRGLDLVVNHSGSLYVTEPGTGSDTGKVWLIKPSGEKLQLDGGLNHPSGIALSPDGLWLAVAESRTHWGYSYRVEPDGTVQNKQRFYWFHVRDEDDDSGAGAWMMDRDGRLYAATRMGVQVFDRNGRVRAILPAPGGAVTNLTFGSSDFDTLYVSCADHKLYRRKLKVLGAAPWAAPIQLPGWSAG
jgi:sugar lactone lactonase YvrE/enterochelin esterase-like enzyme